MPEHQDVGRFTTKEREASVLNHLVWKMNRSTNYRFDPARGETMIPLYEDPSSSLGGRALNQIFGQLQLARATRELLSHAPI